MNIEVMPGFIRRKRTDKIILHHTASVTDLTLADLEAMHKARGYKGVGYNHYIRQTGVAYIGRGDDAIGAHAGSKSGFNSKSVGVSLSGNFDINNNQPTPAQIATLIPLLVRLCRKYNLTAEDIIGHRDVTPTACPGRFFPMHEIKGAVRLALMKGTMDEVMTDAHKQAGITAMRILYSLPFPQEAEAILNKLRPFLN